MELSELIKEYHLTRRISGDDHRKHRLIRQVTQNLGMSWDTFKKKAGFNDNPPLNSLFAEYRRMRKKLGDNLKNVHVFKKLPRGNFIYYRVCMKEGLTWDEFKKRAGFDEPPRGAPDLPELIKEYCKIRKIVGDKAGNSQWMVRSLEYKWLYRRLVKMGIRWYDFKEKAGFSDKYFFGKTLTVEQLKDEFKNLSNKYGVRNVSNTKWLNRNKLAWFLHQVRFVHGIAWNDFKKDVGGFFYHNLSSIKTLSLRLDLKKVGLSQGTIEKLLKRYRLTNRMIKKF